MRNSTAFYKFSQRPQLLVRPGVCYALLVGQRLSVFGLALLQPWNFFFYLFFFFVLNIFLLYRKKRKKKNGGNSTDRAFMRKCLDLRNYDTYIRSAIIRRAHVILANLHINPKTCQGTWYACSITTGTTDL